MLSHRPETEHSNYVIVRESVNTFRWNPEHMLAIFSTICIAIQLLDSVFIYIRVITSHYLLDTQELKSYSHFNERQTSKVRMRIIYSPMCLVFIRWIPTFTYRHRTQVSFKAVKDRSLYFHKFQSDCVSKNEWQRIVERKSHRCSRSLLQYNAFLLYIFFHGRSTYCRWLRELWIQIINFRVIINTMKMVWEGKTNKGDGNMDHIFVFEKLRVFIIILCY